MLSPDSCPAARMASVTSTRRFGPMKRRGDPAEESGMIGKKYDELDVRIYGSPREMGQAAALDIPASLR